MSQADGHFFTGEKGNAGKVFVEPEKSRGQQYGDQEFEKSMDDAYFQFSVIRPGVRRKFKTSAFKGKIMAGGKVKSGEF